MKVILVMVMSVDGKTTKWNKKGIYDWTSKEDQIYFFSLLQKNKVIIMGRKTYDTQKSVIKLSPKLLRIVMTSTPEKYSKLKVNRQLEFTDNSPRELLIKLKKERYSRILLVGGEHLNSSFFKEKLINELWLTVEPILIGKGNFLLSGGRFNISMKLKGIKKINNKGTLLLKYEVLT